MVYVVVASIVPGGGEGAQVGGGGWSNKRVGSIDTTIGVCRPSLMCVCSPLYFLDGEFGLYDMALSVYNIAL